MWIFKMPTRIVFGDGVSNTVEQHAAELGRNPMVVTDSVMVTLPPIRKIIDGLAGATVFSKVQPNPTVENVDSLTRLIREKKADVLIAIGGGSSIDCAKAASCLARTDEPSVRAFHSGGKAFGPEHLPLIAMPTTAGTGAEVTPFAVLDDTEKNFKGPMGSESFYPKIALVDPKLTHSVPRGITAATALDSLSHSIEGYWSRNHQPICDTLALEAARNIFAHLGRVLDNPNDAEGREALSYAALVAGMAFQLPRTAIIHACSFPLSTRFHMPHGTACAFTMEASIRLNAPHMNGRMEAFAVHCGFEDIEAMVRRITALKRQGGLPCSLTEAGIDRSQVERLIKESFHPLINNNPKPVTEKDLWDIFRELGA